MVSPQNKNGGEVYRGTGVAVQAAPDGSSLAYPTNTAIPGASSSPISNVNVARRTPTGWQNTPIAPPSPDVPPQFWDMGFALTADLSRAVFMSRMGLTPTAPPAVNNLFLRHGDGRLELITTPHPTDAPANGYYPYFVGASRDYDRVVFFAPASLTADTPGSSGAAGNLYEWSQGTGTVRPVGVLTDGTVAPGSAVGADAAIAGTVRPTVVGSGTVVGAVSSDASRVFFHAPVPPGGGVSGRLYVKIDGQPTQEVSRSRRAAPDPDGPQPPRFQGAARDGSVAYFTSCEQLTDNSSAHRGGQLGNCEETTASNDLYRYDVEADLLTNVTPHPEAGVSNVMGLSDDGRSVYFIAAGQLAAGAQLGGANLYHWRDGVTSFVADIGSGVTLGARGGSVQVTPDGNHVAFESSTSPTGFDNRDADGIPRIQVYRWTIGDAHPTCVSCRPAGRPTGDASLDTARAGSAGDPSYGARNISADGRRVVFSSPDPLVAGSDNRRRKIFVHEAGEVALISTGRSAHDDYFYDASTDGNDVFFITTQALDAADGDDAYDVYDARVGGGFPADAATAPPCEPAQCRGPLPGAPPSPIPGSVTFTGPGDVASGDDASAAVFAVRPLTAVQRRRWVKRGRVVLLVDVSLPGRVDVRARTGVGDRARVVAQAAQTASRGGTLRLPLRLSRTARARLRRRGALPITLVVRYSASDVGAQSLRVMLRRDGIQRSSGARSRATHADRSQSTDRRSAR